MKIIVTFLTSILVCLGIWACQKETNKTDQPQSQPGYKVIEQWVNQANTSEGLEIEFRNVGDIGLAPLPERPEILPTLIGGQPADPKDWPATMYSSQGNSRCTATIIGKRALLIAAHCVGNGKTAVFKAGGNDYSSTCTHHSEYRGNATADWALCLVSQDVVNVPFERLNTDAGLIKVGEKILLTGFGCTRPGGTGGNDGTYRIGESTVTALPSGTNYDIVTKGGAALCFGDSGGPSFKVDGEGRVLLAVNSRGDIKETSYLVSTATNAFKTFATKWTESNGSKLCGIDADAEGCRGSSTPPGPDPLPPHCKADLEKLSNCLYGNPRGALADAAGCRQAYGNLFACEEAAERID